MFLKVFLLLPQFTHPHKNKIKLIKKCEVEEERSFAVQVVKNWAFFEDLDFPSEQCLAPIVPLKFLKLAPPLSLLVIVDLIIPHTPNIHIIKKLITTTSVHLFSFIH